MFCTRYLKRNLLYIFYSGGWVYLYSINGLSAGVVEWLPHYSIILLHHAPAKVASVLVIFVIFGRNFSILLTAIPLYTRPRIVGIRVENFIFTRKRLSGIISNFAYVLIVLLINYFQSVNWIEILVTDIFAFLFCFQICGLSRKPALIG